MTRAHAWAHPDGHDATIKHIKTVFEKHDDVLKLNEGLYPSMSMQTGVNQDALLERKSLLIDMLDLDPRGGLVSQRDCACALGSLWRQGDISFWKELEDGGRDPEDLVSITAYLLRVMLCHVRNSFDNSECRETHKLKELFSHIVPTPDARKQRRGDRLSRPHPFVNVRADDDNDDAYTTPVQQEPPVMVACYSDSVRRQV